MRTLKPMVLRNLIKQVEPFIVTDSLDIETWATKTGVHLGKNQFSVNENSDSIMQLGERWRGGYDDTLWLEASVTIPECMDGKTVYLQINFGGEGIVKINGEIVGAVSSTMNSGWVHRDIIHLDTPAVAGTVLNIEIENGICCGGFCDDAMAGKTSIEYTLETARLTAIDDLTQKYWYTVNCAFDAFELVADEAISSRIYDAVDSSMHILDFDFDKKIFYNSVPTALNFLENSLSDIPYAPQGEVIMSGHSHIDVAWLWTVREVMRKTARTFSNNLALMDKYPEFKFTQSQAIVYDFIKKYYPELFERVKEKVKNGQWEIVGNAWVEADTNIASGEALIRQLLYGREFFKKEFGVDSDTYWLPDCFGFTWALPQIIKRSGMKYFVTSKLMSNDTNEFPHSLFRWKSHSGDEILAYFQKTHYQGDYTASYINDCWNRNAQKGTVRNSFGMYGYGDGGGGCTFAMVERANALKKMPGLPTSKMAHSKDFFAEVSLKNDELPIWDDELYYENHRGTFTSQAFVKKNNRKGEILYRNSEIGCVLCESISGKSYPLEKLEEGWKLLLVNQFHDILPGTSIHEVYINTRKEYEEMNEIGTSILTDSINKINDNVSLDSNSVVVWNMLSFAADAPVRCEIPFATATVSDCDENVLASSVEKCGGKYYLTFIAKNVPSMGYCSFAIKAENGNVSHKVTATKSLLENEKLRVELDKNGLLSSVYDKQNKREILSAPANLLTIFQDKPIHESAWNLEINYQTKYWDLLDAQSIEVVESSETMGVIEIKRTFNRSTIIQKVILYADADHVNFDTTVDWHETEKMLKAAFPVNIRSTKASYEIAHGSIDRPTHANTSFDLTKFEVSAHKWADLSEGDYGASILNDCKYGYNIKENVMRITLMRSPNCPDRTADHGINQFVYSFYPHKGGWRDAKTLENAFVLNNPLIATFIKAQGGSLPCRKSFIEIDNPNIVIDALKKAQDCNGTILRIYEAKSTRGSVNIKINLPFTKVTECNMMEVDETEINCTSSEFSFEIKPNEVKTFRLN